MRTPPPSPPLVEIVRSHLMRTTRNPFLPPSSRQTPTRTASTNASPTANQFAKNASAAYAKQQQPAYQSKPRSPHPPLASTQRQTHPQQPRSRTSPGTRQDVGAGARQLPQNILTRALNLLSSTFAHNRPTPSATRTGTGTYSVHNPAGARQKLQRDSSNVQSSTASIRQRLGYDAVARRVLVAMVATPIALVTSYVLFQRLVMGEEKKAFPVKPVKQGHGDDDVAPTGLMVGDREGD